MRQRRLPARADGRWRRQRGLRLRLPRVPRRRDVPALRLRLQRWGRRRLHAAPGSDVFACIRGEDVAIERRGASSGSARNRLAGSVVLHYLLH